MPYCNNCGFAIEPEAKFCTACGQPQGSAELPQQGGPEQRQIPPNGADWQRNPFTPPPVEPRFPAICSISEIYSRVFFVLRKKPMLLWGISLMYTLLTFVALWFCVLPVIYVPVVAVLEFGMISVFLAGYRGQPIESATLFTGFNDFKRVAGGMLWMALWVFIWALIPIAGIVIAIIKAYAYRFVPYILLTQPEVRPTDALKRSMEMTKGYKGKMFGADILIAVIVIVAMLILLLLWRVIPFVGAFFGFLYFVVALLCVVFLPLFMGLISASFYDEIERVKR